MKKYEKPTLALIVKETTNKVKPKLNKDQIRRLKTTANVLLSLIGITGLALVSVVAPNALQALKFFQEGRDSNTSYKNHQRRLMRSFYYLKDKGYIKFVPKNRDFKINLTDKSLRKVRELELDILQIRKPLVWDRKFWQVAADIPIQYRRGADALRRKLKEMSFYSLQRTLWFYPYDPRKEIDLLIENYEITPFVTVMKIAKLDPADHKVLYDHFTKKDIIEF